MTPLAATLALARRDATSVPQESWETLCFAEALQVLVRLVLLFYSQGTRAYPYVGRLWSNAARLLASGGLPSEVSTT